MELSVDAQEAVGFLADCVRVNTANPPGDEARLADLLARHLRAADVAAEVQPVAPGRANLLARLRGSDERPTLVLSGHTDTVPSGEIAWQSRRVYISELYAPLIRRIRAGPSGLHVFEDPTGWALVDRQAGEIRRRLEEASTEEQFQAVGLLCREVLISLARTVYDPNRHRPADGTEPSSTDAKRMLDGYLASELGGETHETARRHARAVLDLANDLQHRRTAEFRNAALCAEATTSVVNLIAIIAGRRDPGTAATR